MAYIYWRPQKTRKHIFLRDSPGSPGKPEMLANNYMKRKDESTETDASVCKQTLHTAHKKQRGLAGPGEKESYEYKSAM